MRVTFQQLILSRFPSVLGFCKNDIPDIAAAANEVIQRLLNCFGENGPWGCWDKIAFTITQANPYFTLPPKYSRLIGVDMCQQGIRIQNPFYEVLDAGIGLRAPNSCLDRCPPRESYDRGTFPTMIDLAGPALLRVYPTNNADVQSAARILFYNAKDQNGSGIYTQDAAQSVNGFYLTLENPFNTSTFQVTSFQSIVKDPTQGDVQLTQVDPNTGNEVILSRYGPDETNPSYRRYFFSRVPTGCCNVIPNVAGQVTMTAMAKFEFAPVQRPTDQLIIGNIPAMIEEGQVVHFSAMESPQATVLETKHHRRAVKLLQDELRHYLGDQNTSVAINFAPYGTARLEHVGINMI